MTDPFDFRGPHIGLVREPAEPQDTPPHNTDQPDGSDPQPPHPQAEVNGRFETCRWAKQAADGTPPHCSHPEVLPYAGQHGFVADAWCPDCTLYKLKRKSRKPDSDWS
jgi:hypothetical protein